METIIVYPSFFNQQASKVHCFSTRKTKNDRPAEVWPCFENNTAGVVFFFPSYHYELALEKYNFLDPVAGHLPRLLQLLAGADGKLLHLRRSPKPESHNSGNYQGPSYDHTGDHHHYHHNYPNDRDHAYRAPDQYQGTHQHPGPHIMCRRRR